MSDLTRRRPWLAVLLAVLVSGLGHAYLRRWGRAFGWYVAITATLVLLVPDAAMEQLFAREIPPIADVAPALVVVVASILDAYLVAVRNNREYERQRRTGVTAEANRESDRPEAGGTGRAGRGSSSRDGSTGISSATDPPATGPHVTESTPADATAAGPATEADDAPPTIDCPHCGRETDAEIDFCHWCTEPLSADGDAAE
ncbi:DUF7575 domain-containing protein [Halorubrum tibetense]|uniref:Zinc ribbon domain-containing protein n=1 Tax=Halorubrum tibetense TaxID=175631 RepID=A0ABD5SBH6_9EURY